MKKGFITVLIMCLLIGTISTSVSAVSFYAGSYVQKINANGALIKDNIRAVAKGTDFDAIVTVTPKTSITCSRRPCAPATHLMVGIHRRLAAAGSIAVQPLTQTRLYMHIGLISL